MPELNSFGTDTSRRLLNMLREWERRPKNTVKQPEKPVVPIVVGLQLAVTTSSVNKASSSSTPGVGYAKIQKFDGTTISDAGFPQIKVYNYHDRNVVANSLVGLASMAGYWWVIDVPSCSDLTT